MPPTTLPAIVPAGGVDDSEEEDGAVKGSLPFPAKSSPVGKTALPPVVENVVPVDKAGEEVRVEETTDDDSVVRPAASGEEVKGAEIRAVPLVAIASIEPVPLLEGRGVTIAEWIQRLVGEKSEPISDED